MTTNEGYRILLIEDDPLQYELVKHVFKRQSPEDEIEHADSAASCLSLVGKESFDLLILDYNLPDTNGIGLMEELQSRSLNYPTIIVTAHGDESTAVRAMKLGAADYIVKTPEFIHTLPAIAHKTIENAFLFKRALEAMVREKLVNRITQAVLQSLDIEAILQTICEELVLNLQTDRCCYIEVSGNPSKGVVSYEHCNPPWLSTVGKEFTREQFGNELETILQGRPLIINRVDLKEDDSHLIRELDSLSIKSFFGMPVAKDGKLIGAIALNQCQYYRKWSENEISLMEAISRQCAVALNNASLYRQSRESEERYRSLFENANDAILIAEIKTVKIIDANSKAETLTGRTCDQLLGMNLAELHPIEDTGKYQEFYASFTKELSNQIREASILRSDGTILPVQLSANVHGKGEKAVLQILLHDMTEQRRLEAQLTNWHRRESIGTLTGGIAHDFNNLLAGILGYAELLKKKIEPANTKLYSYAGIIEQSATRGAELAQRLVAFARGTGIKSEIVDLNSIINDTIKLLSPALGKSIEILPLLAPVRLIDANGAQIQQILMNLCLNAKEAMPEGGQIKISTEERSSDNYAVLTVSDTGTGMDKQTISRMFEPFFTTKEEGKGTGLGLAIVNSIVRELKGRIEVESEIGLGTTFRISMPVSSSSAIKPKSILSKDIRGNETILVVDDEEMLRNLAKDLLEAYGYNVLLAADGLEAIEIYKSRSEDIGIVLLDMVMPKMGGHEVFHKLLIINPKVKVVLASGYCPPETMDNIWKKGVKGFVQKPYQVSDLAIELRKALDEKD